MTVTELAASVGKSVPYVLTLRRKFNLPASKVYPEGYSALLNKLLYLLIYSVPDKDIKSLLSKEKKLLELLKVDSLNDEPLWFESLCTTKCGPARLLLSGYDLGHPVRALSIQTGLDFTERQKELFPTTEMGVDVLRELQRYREIYDQVLERVRLGQATVEESLKWARRINRN